MKIVFAALLLTGCGTGFNVETRRIVQPDVIKFACTHMTGFGLRDEVLKLCDTKEECNEYCAKVRGN